MVKYNASKPSHRDTKVIQKYLLSTELFDRYIYVNTLNYEQIFPRTSSGRVCDDERSRTMPIAGAGENGAVIEPHCYVRL